MAAISISEAIKKSRNELLELKVRNKETHLNVQVSASDFRELFLLKANKIIAERNTDLEFQVSDINKNLINYLYWYMNGSIEGWKNFKWIEYVVNKISIKKPELQLDKGILVIGTFGVGKTVIVKAFCEVLADISGFNITYLHSKKVAGAIKIEGLGHYERRPMFIDDIGKEEKEINDFGTHVTPIIDLLSMRYDAGALNFMTANYNMETLTKFYGPTITDRMYEMFNIFILGGESYRKPSK